MKLNFNLEKYLSTFKSMLTKRLGEFFSYNGTHRLQHGYQLINKGFKFVFETNKDNDSNYIWIETNDWWRFLYFKKDGKFNLNYEKRINEHYYCAG